MSLYYTICDLSSPRVVWKLSFTVTWSGAQGRWAAWKNAMSIGHFHLLAENFHLFPSFSHPKTKKNNNTTTRAEDIHEVSHLVESKTWLFSSSFMPWQHLHVAVFWPSAFRTTAVPLNPWKMLLQMRQRWRHFFNNWATGHVAPMWHEWCFFFFFGILQEGPGVG